MFFQCFSLMFNDFQASREVGAHVSPAPGAEELPHRPALGPALLAQAVEGQGLGHEGRQSPAEGRLRGGLRGSTIDMP